MYRGAWQATVLAVARVTQHLATTQQHNNTSIWFMIRNINDHVIYQIHQWSFRSTDKYWYLFLYDSVTEVKWSCSVVSDSSRSHGLLSTRLLCPWDFPGKSSGMGCHCLLQMRWQVQENIWRPPLVLLNLWLLAVSLSLSWHSPTCSPLGFSQT